MQNESNKVEHLDNEQSNKTASKKLRCKFKWSLKCSQENVGKISFHIYAHLRLLE